jgi:hypothetical protein
MTYAQQLARQRSIQEAVQNAAKDTTVSVMADVKAQRILWMAVCAMGKAFGLGPVRAQQFFAALDEVADWLDEMARENDAEYAREKLREQAEKVSGIEIGYLYEERMIEARKKHEAEGILLDRIEADNSKPDWETFWRDNV